VLIAGNALAFGLCMIGTPFAAPVGKIAPGPIVPEITV